MDDFDPRDWDDLAEYAGYQHVVTGERISYAEAFARDKEADPELLRRARELRGARSADRCHRLVSARLYAIGQAAGFECKGRAFAWDDLVKHVMSVLPPLPKPEEPVQCPSCKGEGYHTDPQYPIAHPCWLCKARGECGKAAAAEYGREHDE